MSFFSFVRLFLVAGNLLIQLLDRDFLFGDHVHRVANLRVQVANHLLGPVDLEIDGHAFLYRIGDPAIRSSHVTGRIAAKQDERRQAEARRHQNNYA